MTQINKYQLNVQLVIPLIFWHDKHGISSQRAFLPTGKGNFPFHHSKV